ncbi:FYVE, RhoGEF and PH domain-containing protein 6 [Melanerpes formicivorus]|uniref:FYVE, RhoGEF and PH domain-containing protein 6 n=1 Tax=Melanerpes formicivorus TaxID=211600 RepID=UPI00358EDA80
MSSADVKKPPVAPKPKFVAGLKAPPPPVAPKPEVVLAGVLQAARKGKPAIAPKPKVLKSSSVPEAKAASAARKGSKSLEEQQAEPALPLGHLNHSNPAPQGSPASTAYILPLSACQLGCLQQLGNGESACKAQILLEPLEALEPARAAEGSAAAPGDAPQDRAASRSQVVLKASFWEEKLRDVLSQGVFPASSPARHRPAEKLEQGNGSGASSDLRLGFVELVQCSAEGKQPSTAGQLPAEHLQASELPPALTENHHSCSCPLDQDTLEQECLGSNNSFPAEAEVKAEADRASPETPPALNSKVLPVPRPRRPRAACLVRQDGIDAPAEAAKEPPGPERGSPGHGEQGSKKPAKVNVLGQSVCYNSSTEVLPPATRESTQSGAGREPRPKEPAPEESASPPPSPAAAGSVQSAERSSDGDHNAADSVDELQDASRVLDAVGKRTNFARCDALSMSLPKQLKLTGAQHSAAGGLHLPPPQLEDKEMKTKDESSPKVIPKKPQRHSLPAAGLLKKAASAELVEKSSYPSAEDKPRTVLEGSCFGRPAGRELSALPPCHLPKRPAEKPVWKLPHPILPFSGNSESLKTLNLAASFSPPPVVTKPRAKSLSSVDMDRTDKPCRDQQKKNSLRKFLNMKLSVCLLKGDFQKLLSKGSQPADSAIASLSSGDGCGSGSSRSAAAAAGERKAKSAKAHSVEVSSPASQKKRQRNRSQPEVRNTPRLEAADVPGPPGESLCQAPVPAAGSTCAPEYENVRHYEEIPEYENLPFALAASRELSLEWQNSSSLQDQSPAFYEVGEPCGATSRSLRLGRSLEEHHDHPGVVMGDLQSDEEDLMNSSDEDDDTNSDSSKGEPDPPDDKQGKAAGKKTKVYHIAKEIMSSEKVFVDVLKLLHIDFRDAVAHASRQLGKPVIEDRVLNQILYYLPQLYELNRDLLRELEERLAHWLDHQRIADIFVKKGPYLKMYSTYIKEFDKNIALLDEQCKKNAGFATVVKDFEMSPRCASLALKHYLLKPVQRIPQYRLLLTDYLKNLLEDSADYRDTQDALAVVIEVANHANDIMKQGDNFQKLMQIQYSLSGHHEIVQPGRVFLKEGTLMKLSRKVMQPRMFFLFNDALLYTTPVQSGMYKLNNMLSLAGMKVKKPTQEAYQNELNIESVERSFILSASSATERDEWLEAISKSIEDYTKKRITFNPSRSLEEADPEKQEEDSPLGSKAPIWIPDTRATMCMICTSEFTLTWRRHHCRACGKIVCQACSSNKHGLDYMKNQPARVCDHCFRQLQKQDHQCTPKSGSPVNHRSPSSALSTVLHSIPSGRKQKKIPAALKEVSANTEDSTMSGYLHRSKGNKKPWKHLWFVIKNKVLYTYAASEDVAALESQPLLGFTVSEVKEENSESRVFHLLHKNTLFYIFKADDPHSAQKWIEAFQEGTIL